MVGTEKQDGSMPVEIDETEVDTGYGSKERKEKLFQARRRSLPRQMR
jgi:hypothetical protein